MEQMTIAGPWKRRRGPRSWQVVCVALLIQALATGCGGGGDRSSTTRSDTAVAALRARLLHDDDVPPSYSFTKEQPLLPIPGLCSPHDPKDAAGIAQSLVRIYQASPTGPILASFVLEFRTEESAAEAMVSIAQAGVDCAAFIDRGGCNSRLESSQKQDTAVSYRSVAVCEPSTTETIAHLSFFLDGTQIGGLVNDFAGFPETPATDREELVAIFESRFRAR